MKKDKSRNVRIPSLEEVAAEQKRLSKKKAFAKSMFGLIYGLMIIAAAAILVSTLFLPVLHISGSDIDKPLSNGDFILLIKGSKLKTGDLCAFSWHNKMLIKRVIACPSQWIDIKKDGTVYVGDSINDMTELNEPYIDAKAFGECDIENFPVQVGDDSYFVMGDNRVESIDSRSKEIGDVTRQQVYGKVWFRIFPLKKIGFIKGNGI